MLFNSYEYILIFLPATLLLFHLSAKQFGHEIAMLCLVGASLLFYAWWNPIYIWLIVISMVFNYGIGIVLTGQYRRTSILAVGIGGNLALLGYYKYANFFVSTVSNLTGESYNLNKIILPLAISFFTFQQIAYLMDVYQRKVEEHNFLHYALFVTFFPQLIAGPIVHHSEMMRQFSAPETYRFNSKKMELGLTIFSLGLFKKVALADGIAQYATPIFNAAYIGETLSVVDAWIGTLGYSFQLYFDFSAYSDMAIGAALMFGIYLPVNFMSPYKSVNIIDFWRRWHITLARFLRDYLYIPLGGNRKGRVRRYANLMTTMLLGGLWHGAGWTFVFWGGLHGFYLVINHAWRHLRKSMGHNLEKDTFLGRLLAGGLTFLAVIVAWVYFRAESFQSANLIISTMFGLQHASFLETTVFSKRELLQASMMLMVLSVFIWLLPNVLQWTGYVNESDDRNCKCIPKKLKGITKYQPSAMWAIICATLMVISVLRLTQVSEFLYFQF